MLRLRLGGDPTIRWITTDTTHVSFCLTTCNESGSIQTLASPLKVEFKIVDYESFECIPSACLQEADASGTGLGKPKSAISAYLSATGGQTFYFLLKDIPTRYKKVRIAVDPCSNNCESEPVFGRVIPYRFPAKERMEAASLADRICGLESLKRKPSLSGYHPLFEEAVLLPVCSIITPVIYTREANAKETSPTEEEILALSCSVQKIYFPAPSTSTSNRAPNTTTAKRRKKKDEGTFVYICELPTMIMPGFGCVVWDAAIVLMLAMARWQSKAQSASAKDTGKTVPASPLPLQETGVCFRNKRVVDIGSGTGFVGICAAMMGAHVVLTDTHELVQLLRLNVHMNRRQVEQGGGSVTVAVYYWGTEKLLSPVPTCPGTLYDRVDAGECGSGSVQTVSTTPNDSAHCAKRSSSLSTFPPCAQPLNTHPLCPLVPSQPPKDLSRPLLRPFPPTSPLPLSVSGCHYQLQGPFDIVLASEAVYQTEVFPVILKAFRDLTAPSLENQPLDGQTYSPSQFPLIIMGSRQRACCDLPDFLESLQPHFHVSRVFPQNLDEADSALDIDANLSASLPPEIASAADFGCIDLGSSGSIGHNKLREDLGATNQEKKKKPRNSSRMAAQIQKKEEVEEVGSLEDFVNTASALSKTSFRPLVYQIHPLVTGSEA